MEARDRLAQSLREEVERKARALELSARLAGKSRDRAQQAERERDAPGGAS